MDVDVDDKLFVKSIVFGNNSVNCWFSNIPNSDVLGIVGITWRLFADSIILLLLDLTLGVLKDCIGNNCVDAWLCACLLMETLYHNPPYLNQINLISVN